MAQKGISGIRDLAKTQCWIRETLTGYRCDCYPGSGICQNLGTASVLGKKTIFGIAMTEVRDARFLSRKKRREHGIQSLETGNTCHLAWGSIPVCLSPSWEPECRLTSFCFRKAINGFTRWTSRNYDFKNILSGSKLSFLWAPAQQ